MEENITLNSLIKEHKYLIDKIKFESNGESFGFPYYYYDNEDYKDYQIWLAKTKRYLGIHFKDDKDIIEFENISKQSLSPDQQKKLSAILEALSIFPTVIPNIRTYIQGENTNRETINITTNVNNSNSQSQSQKQFIDLDLFLETIKDDLTGRQIKELKAVVAEEDNDLKKARSGIIKKLKSFGIDVVSNVVANIITNPTIWKEL